MDICHTLLDPSYEGLVWSWMNLEDKSDTKGQILYDFIYMSYLEESIRDRKQNGVCQGLGVGEMMSYCFIDTEFQFCKMKSYRWWW